MKIRNFSVVWLFLYFFSSAVFAETITIVTLSPTGVATQDVRTKVVGESINVVVKPKVGFKGVVKVDGVVVATGEVNRVLRYKYTVEGDSTVETSYLNDVVEKIVTINIKNTGSDITLDTGEYQLVTPRSSKVIDSTLLNIADNTKESHIVSIINKYNEPIMITPVYGDNTEIVLNIKNTAEALVLMRPYFFKTNITDRNVLSKRIQSHAEFQSLVAELKKQIDSGNICPLDPDCSYQAALIAEKIAIETDLTGLVQ
jgi:hypothetical protein